MNAPEYQNKHHVVIVGGGFGGLYTAQALKNVPVRVTLIDKRNFHLFQPLLYQVATGGLSPGDIASPLRAILKNQANAAVIQGEVIDIDPQEQRVILHDAQIKYDSLVVAAGAANYYYGMGQWEDMAPGLKSIEDALNIRQRILRAFEAAEREPDPARRRAWMTFVVIGGGPTGVELAGAIAELAHSTLTGEFRTIDPSEVKIILMEGHNNILPPYPEKSSKNARRSLERLGVEVLTQARAVAIFPDSLRYEVGEGLIQNIGTRTILWAAGMQASQLTESLRQRTGAALDPLGRIMVDSQLTLPDFPDIYVIGDMAHVAGPGGQPLPGIAPVAMQEGRYAAGHIKDRLAGKERPGFRYKDKGTLAVIGRNAAVAVFGRIQLAGFLAWFAWIFIHLWYLIEYDNKLMVMIQWAWNYFTRKRGARLITGGPNNPPGYSTLAGPQPISLDEVLNAPEDRTIEAGRLINKF